MFAHTVFGPPAVALQVTWLWNVGKLPQLRHQGHSQLSSRPIRAHDKRSCNRKSVGSDPKQEHSRGQGHGHWNQSSCAPASNVLDMGPGKIVCTSSQLLPGERE